MLWPRSDGFVATVEVAKLPLLAPVPASTACSLFRPTYTVEPETATAVALGMPFGRNDEINAPVVPLNASRFL